MISRNSLLLLALILLAVLSLGLLWMPEAEVEFVNFANPGAVSSGVYKVVDETTSVNPKGKPDDQIADTLEPHSAGRTPSNAATSRKIQLRIFNEDLWEEAPDAKVYYLTDEYQAEHPMELEQFSMRNPWTFSGLDLLPQATAGPDGIATLEFSGSVLWACSVDGNARGFKSFEVGSDLNADGDQILILPIKGFIAFTVRVFKFDGFPAESVPVKIFMHRGEFSSANDIDTQFGVTNRDGVVIIDVSSSLLDGAYWRVPQDKGGFQLAARASTPFLDVEGAFFESNSDGTREAVLHLPKFGAVELQVQGIRKDRLLYMLCQPARKNDWTIAQDSSQFQPEAWMLDFLPLNQSVKIGISDVEVVRSRSIIPKIIWQGAGPTREGQIVQAIWDSQGHGFLRGRLLRVDGEPLSLVEFNLSLLDSTGEVIGEGCIQSTDHEGRFRVFIAEDGVDLSNVKDVWIRVRADLHPSWEKNADSVLDYQMDLPLNWISAEVDLGDLLPQETSLLISGVVVDSRNGEPIQFAQVYLMDEKGSEVEGFLGSIPTPGSPDPQIVNLSASTFTLKGMRDAAVFAVSTNINGEFKISHGVARGKRKNNLQVSARDYVSKQLEFLDGDKAVVVRMDKLGAVEYSISDSFESTSQLTARLSRTDKSITETEHKMTHGPGNKNGIFKRVKPGIYDFTLEDSQAEILVEITRVKILPGAATQDPRLQAIKITDKE